jgi:endonuclease YncB( thermonuclease family)
VSITAYRSHRRIPRRTDIWPRPWRRRPAGAAVAVLIALILAWSRLHTPSGGDLDRYQNQTFTCVRAVDGDTIDIAAPDASRDHTRIRLWGVDTPETDKSPTGAMYFGAEASAFTHRLVDGKPVRIVLSPDRTRDKYGRLLAYVYVNVGGAVASNAGGAGGTTGDGATGMQTAAVSEGEMLNEQLIAGGYAYADRRFPHLWKERFSGLEEKARKKKLGLWKSVRPDQMPKWRQRYEHWKSGEPEPTGEEE